MSSLGVEHSAPGNDLWLRNRLETLKLRLRRKILWLRTTWAADPLQDYHGLVISDLQADRLLQPDDPVAEAQFYVEDPVAGTLTGQLLERESHERRLESPLKMLGRTFGLSQFEMDALFLCVAPCIDTTFHKLFAYVLDDVTRRLATPGLAISLLIDPGDEPAGAIASLGAGAPLLRHRLIIGIDGATAGLDRQLTIDQRIVDYLCGIDHLDARLVGVTRPIAGGLTIPLHDDMTATVVATMRSDQSRIVNLYGRPDSGQRAVACAACEKLGLRLLEVDLARLATLTDVDAAIGAFERDAKLSHYAFYVAGHDSAPSLVDRLSAPVFLATRERCASDQQIVSLAMPDLTAPDSADLWRQALGADPDLAEGITAITEQFLLGPEAVTEASAMARFAVEQSRPGSRLDPGDLWNACREHSRRDMARLAQPIKPCHDWDDLILPPRLIRQLRDLAGQVTNRAVVYRKWNVADRLNRGRAISALFAGPSGTGKTLAAEILAATLNVDLYRVDLATVIDKYIGETEKRLRLLFDQAEEAGAMLLLDEADALTGRRTEIRDSHDRYANISVSYLLQRMEDFAGLVILATNRRADIDRAFLRRLRFLIEFPFPAADDRQRIWRRAIPSGAPRADIDFGALSRLELNGGSIHNIAINASFLAAADGEPISMRHLMTAAARECAKLDKLITPAEFGQHYQTVVA